MPKLKLPKKIEENILSFIEKLKDIYQNDLISAILYGSAASGEFVDKHSNLNLLVILTETDLGSLKRASGVVAKFKNITPLFLTEDYIRTSTDIFPIEFLDMQENYLLFFGKDVLKEISIDKKNLRFQCEQELKAKLLNLKQLYLRFYKDKAGLQNLLFKSFTSILHVLRNVLRLEGKQPPYQKREILNAIENQFKINIAAWEKILAAKNKDTRLGLVETETLFAEFLKDLEKIVGIVDRF